MAVTSIPVISRIMHDLGILDTTFARVVLGVAVLEDLVLYVVLAVAIGYAGAQAGALFGLPAALSIAGGSNADMVYHVLATLAFLGVSLVIGPTAYRWIGGLKVNLIQRASPIAHQLTFMLLLTIAALGLGIEAFFGALVAGIVVGSTESEPSEATHGRDELRPRVLHPDLLRDDRARARPRPRLQRRLLRRLPARRMRRSSRSACSSAPASPARRAARRSTWPSR